MQGKKKFLSGTSVDSEKITAVVSEKRSAFPGLCIPDDIEQENEVCLFTLREDDDLDMQNFSFPPQSFKVVNYCIHVMQGSEKGLRLLRDL